MDLVVSEKYEEFLDLLICDLLFLVVMVVICLSNEVEEFIVCLFIVFE